MSEENEKSQSRKWLLTINNPKDSGLTHELLIGITRHLGADYFCMSDEIGNDTHTYHTHIGIYRRAPIRFRTIKKRFPTAHIDKAYGLVKEIRDYVRKDGKWKNTSKAETSVPGTFYEEGEMPSESEEKSPSKARVLEMIKDGATNSQILDSEPGQMFHLKDFDEIRQTYTSEKFLQQDRLVDVTYIYGKTGVGKTRSIYDTYSAETVCRITSYRANAGAIFDSYKGQNILVLDEYSSQIPIEELLTYLDRYPVMLRARYFDRIAAYTKVYILSNFPLSSQYEDVQRKRPDQYDALLRRIKNIIHMTADENGTHIILEKGSWDLSDENIVPKN